MFCQKCGNKIPEGMNTCPVCGYVGPKSENLTTSPDHLVMIGMNWYKFLIYFALIAGAVLNFLSAITYITGTAYISEYGEVGYQMILAEFGFGLRLLDYAYAAFAVYIGIRAIIVRSKLAQYKTEAPTEYIRILVYLFVARIIYLIGLSIVVGEFAFEDLIINIIVYGIFLALNRIYFEKRKFLFVA